MEPRENQFFHPKKRGGGGGAISPLFFSSLSFKDSKLQNSNEGREKEELENNTARTIIKEEKKSNYEDFF